MIASIIIPVYNQSHFTKKCVQTIFDITSNHYPFEVIIVDNNSTDDTAEIARELQNLFSPVKYIRNKENIGYGGACNLGSKHASGEVLVFLNNDTEPQKNWLENGLNKILSDESIGILGAKLLYPDRKIQHCGIEFFEEVNPDYYFWPLHRHLNEDENFALANQAGEVAGVTGACMFIRKKLFDSIGGFDEQYWMYFEDLDLCFKVKKQKLKVYYDPEILVIHHEGKSSKNQEHIDELNAKSAKLFFSKWRREVTVESLGKYIESTSDKVTIFSTKIYPQELIENNFIVDEEKSKEEYLKFFKRINFIGDMYVHFGGAGDALLLLSTFYDENPNQIVISFANSINALKSFWESFHSLEHVFIIPLPPSYILHSSIRKLMPMLRNVKGMGATPKSDYETEWGSVSNIFDFYGIKEKPDWVKNFSPLRVVDYQVVIAPKGSLVGMVGSKKNIISKDDWLRTIKFFVDRNISPVILGTPDEAKEYPIPNGVIDKRSYSFTEQMQLINGCDIFIGADSWGKTFSAIAQKKTFVFKPIVGKDLQNWNDVSENIFIKPWKNITLVKNFNELRKELLKITFLKREKTIALDSMIHSMNSLSKVNLSIAEKLVENNHQIFITSSEKIDSNIFSNDFKKLKTIINKEKNADCFISHYFPPREDRPKCKKWIVIQPWEFGDIPKYWVDLFNTKADEIWVPSYFVKNIFVRDGIDESKVHVIPNGFNPDIYNPDKPKYQLKTNKKIKFLFVGGTIYRKGIDILLKAYLSAFNKNDDVALIIKDVASNSVYKGINFIEEIKKIISTENTPEIIYIDENLKEEELAGLYNACDFLVHPYRGEGFGMPVLEAMACGLIPIVTKNGSTDDFCNSKNSLLIPSTRKYFEVNKIDNYETVDKPYLLEPDLEEFIKILKYVYLNANVLKSEIVPDRNQLIEKYSWNNIYKLIIHRIYEDETSIYEPLCRVDKIEEEYNDYIRNAMEYFKKQDLQTAKKYYEKALELNDNSSEACEGLADIFDLEGKHNEAKTMYEYSLLNNLDSDEVFEKLLNANKKLGVNNKISVIEVNEVDEDLEAIKNLIENNKIEEAEEKLNDFLSKDPFNLSALNNLAAVAIMNQDYTKALKFLRRVFLIDGNNEVAKNYLVYIKEIINIKN